jgi:hypothetical protein
MSPFTLQQCSKWTGICQYTMSGLRSVPECHNGTYQYIFHLPFYIFLAVCPYFAFKKYTGTYKFPFWALPRTKELSLVA